MNCTGQRLRIALASVTFMACNVPVPQPAPSRAEPEEAAPAKRVPPPSTVKFDVGPPGPTTRPKNRPAPSGFVELQSVSESLRIDMRYATAANFTGAPLPGYLPGVAWTTVATADALAKVQSSLAKDGLGLLIFDAYRPKRATKAMVDWAKRTGRAQLLDDGYIAPLSNHNRGNTLDLTLVTLANGKEVDMGTAWDTFSEASHYAAARGKTKANRKRLRDAMVAQGFVPYAKEWWHFTLASDPEPPVRDVPYGE